MTAAMGVLEARGLRGTSALSICAAPSMPNPYTLIYATPIGVRFILTVVGGKLSTSCRSDFGEHPASTL